MPNLQPEPLHPEVRFEPTDADARGVVLTAAGIVVTVAVVVSLLYFLYAYLWNRRDRLSPPPLPLNVHGDALPPEPRLQQSSSRDLRELRVYEDDVLEKYRWIDKEHGRVAIPIERAMELLAERGIPPQKAPADLKLFDPRAGSRQTGLEGKVEPEPR